MFSCLLSCGFTQGVHGSHPTPLHSPASEASIHGLPGRKILRQHPPLAPCFDHVQHAINDRMKALFRRASSPTFRRQGLDQIGDQTFPFCFCQIAWVHHQLHINRNVPPQHFLCQFLKQLLKPVPSNAARGAGGAGCGKRRCRAGG